MLKTVQKNVTELNMIATGDVVLAAVSGGADSVCLLLVLEALKKDLHFALEVVHVEHGIRGEESRQDAAFVEDLCKKMQLPYHIVSVDAPGYSKKHGVGIEEAARNLRYEAFEKLAGQRNAKVALAHHMEDNAETILFQMLRGSGLTGLCGMKPVRREAQVTYIRPLLMVRREEIEDFLKSHSMGWCEDSTNREVEYSRNYLRHMVMPHLVKLNEQAVEHMNRSAVHLSEVRDFIAQETVKAWDTVVQERVFEDGTTCFCVTLKALQGLHRAIQKEVLMQVIATAAGSRKDIEAGHIEDLLALCEKQSGKEVHLPYGLVGRREFDELTVVKAAESQENFSLEYRVTEEELEQVLLKGTTVNIPFGEKMELQMKVFSYDSSTMEIPKKTYTKWLDYDKIKQGFCIRTRRNGDYFIGDALGHHKKLQNYFVDEKISLEKREKMWLLAQDSCVLWLIGGRISENLKVTEDTKFVVELEYIGG